MFLIFLLLSLFRTPGTSAEHNIVMPPRNCKLYVIVVMCRIAAYNRALGMVGRMTNPEN